MSEINNTQVDNAKDTDVVMPMYNLIEYNDSYSKTSGRLWQYYRDEPALDIKKNINFPADNNGISFKFKEKIKGQTGSNGTKDVEKIIPIKYLSNFWRTLEMSLINCETNPILTFSVNCFLVAGTVADQVPTFTINLNN